MAEPQTTQIISRLVGQLRAGDERARDALIEHACERIRVLVRIQLRQNAKLHRWEQTDDVLQNVLVRLCRALKTVSVPDVRSFFALASAQIRRELIDLWRHHYGPEGGGRHHVSVAASSASSTDAGALPAHLEPAGPDAAQLIELHELVERMEPEVREVMDMVWYQGLSHEEAAELLGVSSKTIGRRWREARIQLGQALSE